MITIRELLSGLDLSEAGYANWFDSFRTKNANNRCLLPHCPITLGIFFKMPEIWEDGCNWFDFYNHIHGGGRILIVFMESYDNYRTNGDDVHKATEKALEEVDRVMSY